MGLKEFFRRKSPIEKASKDLREPYAQPDVRRQAMGALLDIATEEAYVELLRRFSYNSNGAIHDEEEKRDLVDYIVNVGEPMISPLRAYIAKEKTLTFPIRALKQLISKDDTIAFLVETLTAYEPLDHRSTEAKRSLIIAIGDLGSEAQAEALHVYLDDHNDDVQNSTIEALERLAAPASTAAIAEVCCSDMHAARIQHRAAVALMSLSFNVKRYYDRFQPDVKSEFMVGKKGMLVKKGAGKRA